MSEIVFRSLAATRVFHQGRMPVTAIAPVTCTIASGERIALIGRSGSGKTTFLNLVAGLEAPSAGTVDWPALGSREALRPAGIGVVFQSRSLLPALNCRENVELPLRLVANAYHAGGAAERATDALAAFGVEGLADKLPEEISGGQAQRVALARAIVTRPQLILADEPTGQLDRRTSELTITSLLDWLHTTGAAILLATHDPAAAERMGRIWSIDRGILDPQQTAEAAQ